MKPTYLLPPLPFLVTAQSPENRDHLGSGNGPDNEGNATLEDITYANQHSNATGAVFVSGVNTSPLL